MEREREREWRFMHLLVVISFRVFCFLFLQGGMVRDRTSDVSAACRKLMTVDTPGERLIGVWVWEYVLKHTSDVSIVKELSEAIAFPKGVPRLKQMAVIRQLANQVSKDLDIDKTLGYLEALEHSFEKEPVDEAGVKLEDVVLSKRLKTSSCEASERIVKVRGLHKRRSSESSHDAGDESIWKGLQQPVLELKEELRELLGRSASVEEDAQHANVKVIEGKLSALIKNAWALFGPVFLEKTEAAVVNGEYKPQGVSLALPLPSGQNVAGTAGDNGANPRNEDVSESAKQVLDECCVELQKNVSGRNKELERARQALADSRAEMEKLVKDPLPALLRKPNATAEVPESTPGEKRQTAEPAVKRSLLEPHPSAQAQGWDDDEIQESPSPRSPSASRRLHLPPIHSPERTSLLPRKPITGESSFATGPGSKYRRQRKKWSDEEVEILKREVHKYGKGNWKAILRKHKDVFHGRTEVDMKDKWRNLEKYGVL